MRGEGLHFSAFHCFSSTLITKNVCTTMHFSFSYSKLKSTTVQTEKLYGRETESIRNIAL